MVDRPFVQDAVLTAIAIGYSNPANTYIADQVLPRRPVTAEKFKWTSYPIAESFNVPDGRVGRTGQVPQLEFSGEERTSSVEDFGFDAPLPYSDIDAAQRARDAGISSIDPEATASMRITDTLMNIRELRVAAIVHNPASYAPTRRIQLTTSASRFDDYANSDPIGVLKAGFDATLVKRPNKATMGRGLWSKLRDRRRSAQSDVERDARRPRRRGTGDALGAGEAARGKPAVANRRGTFADGWVGRPDALGGVRPDRALRAAIDRADALGGEAGGLAVRVP